VICGGKKQLDGRVGGNEPVLSVRTKPRDQHEAATGNGTLNTRLSIATTGSGQQDQARD